MVPNPRRFGADTGGPSRSVQLMVRVSPSIPQQTSTRPLSVERPVFAGVGGELVEREPDRLCGGGLQAQLGAIHDDARTNEICEMRELGAGQVLDVHTAPVTPYQQVLIG